ncbi:MAG: beta-ketoacyl-[Bacteroidaceae bacterium]|nr:beta-ketoacyl-[acyl-carrier-protein] synthase family protein [Bacteroidaceae bacterium]
MNRPIFITGAGIISPIGTNMREVSNSLKNKEAGISAIKYLKTEHTEFPVGEVKLSNREMMQRLNISDDTPTTRTSLMGIWALKEAIEDAGLSSQDLNGTGFISGTTVGGMDMSEQFYLDFLTNNSKNEYIATHDCGACTEMIADYFGGFNFVTSTSTACSSAANAIILGANIIKNGLSDIVIVGGSECITKFHLNGFNSLMILDEKPCRPFDETRAGLNLGEGAAYIVLESEDSVKRRNAKIKAVLKGYGNACDAFHQTASSPDGEGAFLSMREAIDSANLKCEEIDYINAHGTGTPNNDLSESQAVMRIFGEAVPPISSTKSYTGHTTSASGSIELALCLIALEEQFLPVNLNWENKAEGVVAPVTESRPSKPISNILCNSFGFGGNDSSLIISKWD